MRYIKEMQDFKIPKIPQRLIESPSLSLPILSFQNDRPALNRGSGAMCCKHPISFVEYEHNTATHVCTNCGEVISDVKCCEGYVQGRDDATDEFDKEEINFINFTSNLNKVSGSKVVRGLGTLYAPCESFEAKPTSAGEAFLWKYERDLQLAATEHGIDVEIGENWERLLDVAKFYADKKYTFSSSRNAYLFGRPDNVKIKIHGICSFVAREIGCESPTHREKYIDGVNKSSRKLETAVRRVSWEIREFAKSGGLDVGPSSAERKVVAERSDMVKRVAEAVDRIHKKSKVTE
ncbi:hypothetical protein FOL47_007766 [Perkinsus chesapeaki]|uniref:Uncharacterized protein n=1 Tax=Perkinsus chesapeaki TaxID=330153 RepID=A0A7J6LI71_PERCH|nr:hypothetical protein FOL47_007766 [Perkinsus chesapeaki]